MDYFKQDSDRITRLLAQLKSDLHRRDQKKTEGKMTGMIEAEIRGSLSNLDRELDLLSSLINQYQNDPKKFSLLAKEVQRRRNIYVEYVNQRNDLKKRIENSSLQQQQKSLFNGNSKEENKATFQQRYDGMDNKGLHSVQTQLQVDQDEQLDRINEKVTNVKYMGISINDNIKQQNKMLDQLHEDVDKTSSAMLKTKNKMARFVSSSSSCGLLVIIFLEIMALVMILVLL